MGNKSSPWLGDEYVVWGVSISNCESEVEWCEEAFQETAEQKNGWSLCVSQLWNTWRLHGCLRRWPPGFDRWRQLCSYAAYLAHLIRYLKSIRLSAISTANSIRPYCIQAFGVYSWLWGRYCSVPSAAPKSVCYYLMRTGFYHGLYAKAQGTFLKHTTLH